jgi:hypothetical protein
MQYPHRSMPTLRLFTRTPIPEALIFRFFFACPILFEKGLLARPFLNVT